MLIAIQNYSDTYTSAYNSGWMIGLIIHICLALGILRLITWGLRALFSNTMMKGDKRRAAVTAFGVTVGLVILYVIVTRMNMPKYDYDYIPGRGMMRIEYQYLGIVPVMAIYLSMLVLWLIVDLKLAGRYQPEELSIFSKDEKPTPQGQQTWPNAPPPHQPYSPYAQPYPPAYPPPYPPQQYVAQPPQYGPRYANSYPPVNPYQSPASPWQPPPPASPSPTVQSYWQAPPPPTTPSAQAPTVVDEAVPNLIRQLATLRDSGVLSKEEFEEKKTQLLNRIT